MKLEHEEKIKRLIELKEKIDTNKKLNKSEMTFLYEEATLSIGFIGFRAIVTGAAPKASKGGYYEIKLDTKIDGSLAHMMTDIFKCAVSVTIDPDDGQGKLRGEDGIPIEEKGLFGNEVVESEEEESEE